MKTTELPNDPQPAPVPAPAPRTLVWDLPLRAFHWLLALSFGGAWLTAESERWRDIHVILGYTVAVLIGFRLLWGLLGTRYARFSALTLSPRALREQLAALWARRPLHSVGHNAPGSWAIVGLLGLLAGTVATGTLQFLELGPNLGELHDGLATATLALVAVHVLGVMVSSVLHRENLVRAMITGTKRIAGVPAAEGARSAVAAGLVAVVVALWTGAIPSPGLADAPGWRRIAGNGTAAAGAAASSDGAQSSARHGSAGHRARHQHHDNDD
jgi:cytochrome b